MRERFHDGLAAATLQELSERTHGAALVRALVQVTLLAASTGILLAAPEPWLRWPAFAIQVLMQFAMFGLLHETIHGTAFASTAANGAGSWIAAVWQFAPPAWMRAFHFQHHRHTHELALDPELSGLAWMARWPRGVLGLANASGLPILLARVLLTGAAATGVPALFAKALPYVARDRRAAVARDARILLAVHAMLVALGLTVAPGVAWLYAAAVAAHALLSIYLTCEHRGLPGEGDVLARTRSIRAGWQLRFLLWNMPYHAEHHAYPSVPFHALPRLHRLLQPALRHQGRSVLDLYRRA